MVLQASSFTTRLYEPSPEPYALTGLQCQGKAGKIGLNMTTLYVVIHQGHLAICN